MLARSCNAGVLVTIAWCSFAKKACTKYHAYLQDERQCDGNRIDAMRILRAVRIVVCVCVLRYRYSKQAIITEKPTTSSTAQRWQVQVQVLPKRRSEQSSLFSFFWNTLVTFWRILSLNSYIRLSISNLKCQYQYLWPFHSIALSFNYGGTTKNSIAIRGNEIITPDSHHSTSNMMYWSPSRYFKHDVWIVIWLDSFDS